MTIRIVFRIGTILIGFLFLLAVHAGAAEQIRIDGSSGVRPLAKALAEAYQKKWTGVEIKIGKGMKTKARIRALADGKINIATASHGINRKRFSEHGLAVHRFAKIAVVFGVNSGVPAKNLTDQQICGIYTAKITDWKQLGLPALPVAPRTRPDDEVDAEVARSKIPCLKNLKMAKTVKVMPKSGRMARALASTPGAIGMTTMVRVHQSKGRIKAVSLNGIAPSAKNMKDGRYTLTRDAFLVTRANPSTAVTKFLKFIRSPEGEKVIIENNAAPAN
jgi:phosphate transport system substrate-binding protein